MTYSKSFPRKRWCKKCQRLFQATSKYHFVCYPCTIKANLSANRKKKGNSPTSSTSIFRRKWCMGCGELFKAETKKNKMCLTCKEQVYRKRRLKMIHTYHTKKLNQVLKEHNLGEKDELNELLAMPNRNG